MSEANLRSWLEECYRTKCTHMLLVVDRTEGFALNPVKVHPTESVYEVINYYRALPGNEVTEVYSMKLPMEEQLNAFEPVFNYD